MNRLNGVTFGEYHSYDDFSLILKHTTVEPPSAKSDVVDVPGSNDYIDLTDFFGDVKYNRRILKMEFTSLIPMNTFLDVFSDIQNAIHGKRMHIVLGADPEFYYVGRINCSEWGINKVQGTITITAECDPFKYKLEETVVNLSVSGTTTFNFINLRKPIVPTINVSAPMQVTFKETTYSLEAGEWQIPEIEFTEGDNGITFTGTGNVTVTYQEGSL